MKKAHSATRPTPPRVRSSADARDGGSPPDVLHPPTPPPIASEPAEGRPPANGLLVAFNALAIIVVMCGGMWYAARLPGEADGTRRVVLLATLGMVFALILITPAYMGGWIDRRKESRRKDLEAPGEPEQPGRT